MKIIFSAGDINGIGLECFFKAVFAFSNDEMTNDIEILIACNSMSLREYFEKLNSYKKFDFSIKIDNNAININNTIITIIDCNHYSKVEFGKNTNEAGSLASESIEIALKEVISKNCDAIVTLPISKKSMYLSGWEFPGHTEMIASKCNTDNPLMILFCENLRVALETIHDPINNISNLLSIESIAFKLNILNDSLKNDYAIPSPKIAVLGLNPHAGEQGSIGHEEVDYIIPAINKAQNDGIYAVGPFPADGFFGHPSYKDYDAILAMYHDQGLIPLKLLAQDSAVNFTAGLPIVRTSPGHGTAFDIAGKGIASGLSTLKAFEFAIKVVKQRKNKLVI